MKKLTIALFVMLLTSTVAFAQVYGSRTGSNDRWRENNFPMNDHHRNCDYNQKGPGKHKHHGKKHKKHDHRNNGGREYGWNNGYPNRQDQRKPFPFFKK